MEFILENIINNNEWDSPKYKFPDIKKLFNKRIIIYGAGRVGKDYYSQLVKFEKIKIVSWIDKKPDSYSYPYYAIRSLKTINTKRYDYIIIAVLNENIKEEIIAELKEINIPIEKMIWRKPITRTSDNAIPDLKEIGYNIVKIMGGLGNQMFQYALYKALNSKGISSEVNIIDYSEKGRRPFELLKVFPNICLDIDAANDYNTFKNPLNKHSFFQEREDGVYDKTVFEKQDTSFSGYWQSEKYFKEISSDIRKDFQFSPKDESLIKYAKKIKMSSNAISLHIRRGDYLKFPELYGGICTLEYYKNAMQYIEKIIHKPQYFVFSDDLSWVKTNIEIPNAFYISSDLFSIYSNWYDMYLMSCCKHNIVANSSFSWWGAWLNANPNKIVIAPKIWLNNKACSDIWCDGWIKV